MIDEKKILSQVTPIERGVKFTREKILADIKEYKEKEEYFRKTQDFLAAEDASAMVRAAQEQLKQLEEKEGIIKSFKEEKKEPE